MYSIMTRNCPSIFLDGWILEWKMALNSELSCIYLLVYICLYSFACIHLLCHVIWQTGLPYQKSDCQTNILSCFVKTKKLSQVITVTCTTLDLRLYNRSSCSRFFRMILNRLYSSGQTFFHK